MVYVVDKCAFAVDLDNGEPFAVLRLEHGISADIHFVELERDLSADILEDLARTLTQVATLRVVKDDLRLGTRCHLAAG
jgi:hypothetical protein